MLPEFYPGYRSHRWGDQRGMPAACKVCGLDSWQAENTGPCRGHVVYVCPTENNGNTHGQCGRVFATQHDALVHHFQGCAAAAAEWADSPAWPAMQAKYR